MRSASMRPEAALAHEPLLLLPGFKPGALGFATRTTIALLLAYFTAFLLQLDTASSAGLCVGQSWRSRRLAWPCRRRSTVRPAR